MDRIIHTRTHLMRQERTWKEDKELKTVSCCKTCYFSYLWGSFLSRSCSSLAPFLCKIPLQREYSEFLFFLRCRRFWILCWPMMISMKITSKLLVSLSSILPLNLPLFQLQGNFLPIYLPLPCAKSYIWWQLIMNTNLNFIQLNYYLWAINCAPGTEALLRKKNLSTTLDLIYW